MGDVRRAVTWRDFPRPTVNYYETRFKYLSQGDIFDDVPYALLGPEILLVADEEVPWPQALVPLAPVRVMLVTPTCDFRRLSADQLEREKVAPYTLETRVRVAQVMDLTAIEKSFEESKRAQNLDILRRHDGLRKFMYLPALEGEFGESAVSLGPAWLVHLELLLQASRLTQLTFAAARQLHYKIVMYETSTIVFPDSFNPPVD
ncbi:MAG TPA: hypothetical protein VGR87_00570 [Candidatus Limnocylindria bacterium]|nr:hypothetical protein [Candidatus Limnocylindria bacterium]